MPLCSRARSLPLRRKPLFPQLHRLPARFGPALSGGVEPVPHPGLRQDCSAGKLTCAGAPPLCCLLFQPDAKRRRTPDCSAGTHLSAAQSTSVRFDTPLL